MISSALFLVGVRIFLCYAYRIGGIQMKKRYIVLGLVAGAVMSSAFTAKPAIYTIRNILFKIPVDLRSKTYTVRNVHVETNKTYDSAYANNTYDLYTPENPNDAPLIAWVHGGGFIGGDKVEVAAFATALAHEGYRVAVMNYALVPQAKYPVPVVQVSDFLRTLNEKDIILAGDSAGAHIASQWLLTQTNPDYTFIDVPRLSIHVHGALLYCGPYDALGIVNNASSPLIRSAFHYIGWGYFGSKKWATGDALAPTTIANYVTAQFPPAYITDGNKLSFEAQGKALAEALAAQDVHVKTRFFEPAVETFHEYQFMMDTEPAKLALQDTLDFLSTIQSL